MTYIKIKETCQKNNTLLRVNKNQLLKMLCILFESKSMNTNYEWEY